MGAGTIGLLATLALRLRGMEVTTFALPPKENLHAELIETLGARYLSTREVPILAGVERFGPFDLILEATGASPVAFESMQAPWPRTGFSA
jgi:threonine dehydrogenase-like Zn-dependent dehydrogenase